MTALSAPTGRTQTNMAVFLAVAMAAVVGGALAIEHVGGYLPCKLCLEQRTPYYVGAPLMVVAALSAAFRLPPVLTRGLLLAGAALMAYGLYLGVFHSGVEWGWWPGPTDCAAVTPAPSGGSNGVLDSLNTVFPPSCDKAALRFLGLSLAGWNAIASAILLAAALRGAFSRG